MEAKGEEVDLSGIVLGEDAVDERVPHGKVIVRFGEAVVLGSDADLASARKATISALGDDAFVDAAGVIGHFERMVRVADATGIPLDPMTEEATTKIRVELGINSFPMANRTISEGSEAPLQKQGDE